MKVLIRTGTIAALLLVVMAAAPTPCFSGEGTKSWQTPLVIPAADFKTTGDDPEGHYFHATGYMTGEGWDNGMVAPVYLPNGAVVHRIEAQIMDNASSCTSNANIQAQLDRVHYGDGVYENMAYATSSGASFTMQTIFDDSISNATVNNMVYAYWVHIHFCSMSHRVYSVVIYYSEG